MGFILYFAYTFLFLLAMFPSAFANVIEISKWKIFIVLIPMDAYSLDLHLKNVLDLLQTILKLLKFFIWILN